MKYKIILVPFPFDDLSASKVRPAICLTNEIRPYGHVVLAFITSNITNTASTDVVIENTDADFSTTGLKVSSAIRLHRLMTVSRSIIKKQLGELSASRRSDVDDRLRELFGL
jgi:mRNA interferase MazF